jgi:hypothetical protein
MLTGGETIVKLVSLSVDHMIMTSGLCTLTPCILKFAPIPEADKTTGNLDITIEISSPPTDGLEKHITIVTTGTNMKTEKDDNVP